MKAFQCGSAAMLAIALAACESVTPGPELALPPGPAAGAEAGNLVCTVRTDEDSFSCGGVVPETGGANPALVTGGQGTYVFLEGTNVVFVPGTGSWSADITVQNLIPQPLGTTDGTTLHPDGVRVFFTQEPVVTAPLPPAGSITIVNNTGRAAFTASNQAFYQYPQLLQQNQTSSPINWQFAVPEAATQFQFRVAVSAEVEFPDGYVDVTAAADTLVEGQTATLTPVVRDARGDAVGGTVTWGSSDPTIATVDGAGLVTGINPGTATITATSGVRTGTATVAVCPDLALGVVYVADMPAGSSFCLGGVAAGAEYTVVPVNVSAASSVSLAVTGAGIVPVTGDPTPNRVPGPRMNRVGRPAPQPDLGFERRLRQMERAIPRNPVAAPRPGRAPGGPRLAIVPGVPAVGALMTLNVETDNSCSTFDNRTGQVMAVGTHVIVMSDALNPPGGFSTAQFEAIADSFDVLIRPAVTGLFGTPADIDGNGRVIAFYTTAVNALTPPGSSSFTGGFFFARDLFSVGSCPTSNLGEMFYMLAPDPAGTVNGNVRTTAFVFEATFRTLGHEFQHLINASRRMHVNTPWNGEFEDVWMDEGLSSIAEEQVFYAATGFAPRTNLGLTEIAAEQDAFFKYSEVNFGRFRQWLISPHTNGPFQSDDDLATRGATWAFLRYAADRQGGPDATFFGSLVNTGNTGVTNLQAVLGTDPLPWFRDFAAATYIDDAVGSPPLSFQHRSWDFRGIFEALDYEAGPACSCIYPLVPRNPANGVSDNFTLANGGAAAFLRMGTPAGAFAGVTILSGGVTPAGTVRVAVIRRE